jgi:hypothetical protein
VAIVVPAVGDTATAGWADSVANQLNAADIGQLAIASRTTASGAITAEAILSVLNQVAFTLATQRRVRWTFRLLFDSPSAANITPQINVRRNATGAVVTTSDTRVAAVRGYMTSSGANQGVTLVGTGTELLAAGTYAYGLGASCSNGSGQLSAASDNPAVLDVFDAGPT